MFITKKLHNKMIKAKENEIDNLKNKVEDTKKLKQENADLRFEIDELTDFFARVTKLVNSNKYNNEKAVFNKIKELISDYQSQN